jgi:hypothetical protein
MNRCLKGKSEYHVTEAKGGEILTKTELKQIYYLNKELRMWQEELQRLQDRIEQGAKQIDGMPRGSGVGDPVGNIATELANCKMMISCKEFEIQIQRNRFIKYIDSLEDSLMRQIIFYRCVSCMGWAQVAASIGGKATAASVRMAFNRHFTEGGK